MKVYRYLREDELNNILNNRIDEIGGNYYGMDNSFSYKQGCKYLHFFKDIADIEYIRNLKNWRIEVGDCEPSDFYVCEFDIPRIILMLSAGEGVYNKTSETPDGLKIKEFAIKAKNFKVKWLKCYVKDNLKEQFDAQTMKAKLEGCGVSEAELGST